MSEQKVVLHLLSRDSGWEESWHVLSLASVMNRSGVRALVAAPGQSWAEKNAPVFGVDFEPLAIGSAANPLTWMKLGALVKKIDAAVVHAHDYSAAVVTVRARMSGCRRVASLYRRNEVDSSILKLDVVFAASERVKGRYDSLHLLYAGADTDVARAAAERRDAIRARFIADFCPVKEKPLFLASVGPFNEAGRQRALLDIMPDILARLPQTHLLLAGDGSDYPELERLVRIMALENDVTFLEPEPDFLDLLAASDLYVSMRRDDDAGIMIHAAMAAGRAGVVGGAGIGQEFHTKSKVGVSIAANQSEDKQAEDCKGAVLHFLQNRHNRDHHGRLANARESQSYCLTESVKAMLEAYQIPVLDGGVCS